MNWALEVDPSGERTLGVVTKADLAGAGESDLGTRLLGVGRNAWKFRLGCVALCNRTQQQLKAGATASAVTLAESKFFLGHSALRELPLADREAALGIAALSRKLVAIQSDAVLKSIPALQQQMTEGLRFKEKALASLPVACISAYERSSVLHKRASQLSTMLENLCHARHAFLDNLGVVSRAFRTQSRPADDSGAVSGGAASATAPALGAHELPIALQLHMMPRLQDLFEGFDEKVRRAGNEIFGISFRTNVATVLAEVRGSSLPDQPNPAVFSQFVAYEVSLLKGPADDLCDDVHDYMAHLCGVLVSECFSGFPDLIREVTHVLGCVLAERLEVVQRHVAEQLLMEREEFTLNHYYSATLTKLRNRMAAESKKIKEDTTEGSSFFVRTVWNDAVADNCTEDGLPALTSESHYMPHIRKGGGKFGTATVDTNQRADAACPLPVSNMDHAVLETQMRLFCYRKVVYKRLLDQIAGCLRLHFPRYLRDEVGDRIIEALTGPASQEGLLETLMREPLAQARERAELVASIARLKEGLAKLRVVMAKGLA